MPDFSSLLSKHFKVAHLPTPIVLTIKDCKAETVGQDRETKPVVYFTEDNRGLVLNATRFNVLATANNSIVSEDWIGTVVEFSADPNVKFQGRETGSILIKVVKPAKAK